MTTTYAKLDYFSISQEINLALRELTNWLCSKDDIVRGFGAMEGEGDKYIKNPALMRQIVMNQVLPAMVTNDPRKLYEFLDDHQIRISISEHPDSTDENISFTYYNSAVKESHVAPSRQEAENNAFIDAMRLLQKRISEGPKE